MQTVILLMAGSGSRVGLDMNKLMYKVNNKRLYQYSLDTFLKMSLPVILVVSKADYETVYNEVGDKVKIVIGGKTRNESVKNALELVKTDRVMIHDAARPLITEDIIGRCIDSKASAYYVCIDLKDTIRDKFSDKTLDRSLLVSVQTPQGGDTELFKKYEHLSTTDDISSFDNLDINIEKIEGNDYNFKITTRFDLKIFEHIVKGD